MKKLIFLLSILLLGKAFSQDSVKSDYLPLSSGNTWQYFGYNYTGNLTPNVYYYATDISSVQKKVTVGLDTFYLLNNDTLRYDKAEDVIYSPASVYMDFTRAAGYSYPGDGISKTTVITGNYSFLDSTYQCKGFERTFDDMLHATDNSCYFARSLGPVHKYSNSRNMGGYVYGSSMGLIMAIIKDSAGNFVSFTKHYKPAISVTPLLKTGSSVFNLDITIRHKYQQISGVFVDSIWGLVNNITGNNFIDSALFESFYSLKDSIQKCPPMLLMGTIPETNYTVSTAIDTVLMKKGFTFNYRIKAVDKGIIPEYSCAPDSGYYQCVWQDSVSAIKENAKPYEFNLYQNFPNPFNPKTVIRYQLTATEHVTLIVYNLPGDEIEKLVDEDQHAGMHSVVFPRSNGQLASGMYFYRLLAGGKSLTKKMILMK